MNDSLQPWILFKSGMKTLACNTPSILVHTQIRIRGGGDRKKFKNKNDIQNPDPVPAHSRNNDLRVKMSVRQKFHNK